jgi:DNA-binding transcriptional MerR regulator
MVVEKQYRDLLTASDVARMLNVHINTVRRRDNIGILGALRIGPRRDRRYEREEVTRFLMQLTQYRELGI